MRWPLILMAFVSLTLAASYNVTNIWNYQAYPTTNGFIWFKDVPATHGSYQIMTYTAAQSNWTNLVSDVDWEKNYTNTNGSFYISKGATRNPTVQWCAVSASTVTFSIDAMGTGATSYILLTSNTTSVGYSILKSWTANFSTPQTVTSAVPTGNCMVLFSGVNIWVYNLTITVNEGLFISTYDENNPTASKLFNLTIANASNSTNYIVNYTWFNASIATIPSGDITLTVSNNSCQTGGVIQRQYSHNTNDGGLNWTAYLLCDGFTPVVQQIIVKDQYQNNVVGATVTIQRVIGSSNATIAQLTTDGVGLVSSYLTSQASYYVTISKTGYTGTTFLLTATNNIITQPITKNTIFGFVDDILLYANWTMTPASYLDFPTFGVNITVGGTALAYYGLNLTLANGTQLFYQNLTNATGSTINSPLFNRNLSNGTLYSTVFIGKDGYAPFYYTRTFSFMNQTNSNSSVTGIIAYLQQSDMSYSLKGVIAVFLSLFFAVGGMFVFGAGGAGLAFVLSLGFFGLVLGFLEANLIYLIIVISLAMYAIQKGF